MLCLSQDTEGRLTQCIGELVFGMQKIYILSTDSVPHE